MSTERAAQFGPGWDLPTRLQSQTEQVVDSSTNSNQASFVTRTDQLNELPNLSRDGTCQRVSSHKLSK